MKQEILFDFNTLVDLSEYGIDIPLFNMRITKTIERLQEKFFLVDSSLTPIRIDDLKFAHSQDYIQKVLNQPDTVVEVGYELIKDGKYERFDPLAQKRPFSEIIQKMLLHAGGTYQSSLSALDLGFSYFLGGGMHHAMSFGPGGFCLLNDIVIAARKLQSQYKVKKVLVVDLDCHKGDGTAEITASDDTIYTFSIHMKAGWPLDQKKRLENGRLNPSFISSDLDVAIGPFDDYLNKLAAALAKIDLAQFDLAIVVHGADVFIDDVLPSAGGIKLSEQEVLQRDQMVFNWLKSKNIPQSWCLGGGYGASIYKIYCNFLLSINYKYLKTR
ncbi:MAG: histone deacetylase [Bacteriovoracaceae bacterium]|nr:hypothetical protein [Halobacteriovoraceae bacterium]MDP7321714.1 histone deacetylase [Bacteriovoracaceae bacterium]